MTSGGLWWRRSSWSLCWARCIAARVRLQLAKTYSARGDQGPARHLMREIDDILLHRPALGALVDEVSEFPEILASSTQQRVTGASPLTPAELRLLPYLQTHLTIRESGSACSSPVTLSARRSARSTGNWASRHATVRCSRQRRSVCSAGSRHHPTRWGFEGIVDVVPERHREFRGGRDAAWEPDDGRDADQRGEPDKRQRLRIQLFGHDSGSADAVLPKCASLKARRRSRSV